MVEHPFQIKVNPTQVRHLMAQPVLYGVARISTQSWFCLFSRDNSHGVNIAPGKFIRDGCAQMWVGRMLEGRPPAHVTVCHIPLLHIYPATMQMENDMDENRIVSSERTKMESCNMLQLYTVVGG